MWTKGTHNKLAFGIPIIWREPMITQQTVTLGLMESSRCNKNNKCKIKYPNQLSAIHPVFHSVPLPMPGFIQHPSLEDLNHDEESVTAMIQILILKLTHLIKNSIGMCQMIWLKFRDCQKRLQNTQVSRPNEKYLLQNGEKVSYF